MNIRGIAMMSQETNGHNHTIIIGTKSNDRGILCFFSVPGIHKKHEEYVLAIKIN